MIEKVHRAFDSKDMLKGNVIKFVYPLFHVSIQLLVLRFFITEGPRSGLFPKTCLFPKMPRAPTAKTQTLKSNSNLPGAHDINTIIQSLSTKEASFTRVEEGVCETEGRRYVEELVSDDVR